MTQPQLNFTPLRAAVCSESSTTLDLIVQITPPAPAQQSNRPPINLGLVIDRSGSMADANKMDYACQAARYAVQQLQGSDRVSIVIFDDAIEVLVPTTPALDKCSITHQIDRIRPGGSTNLHGGWLEGGVQVSHHLKPSQLNRVIVLSDGLANVGETNPDVICSDVHGLAKRGVSTSTMGLGDDYNEDLLEAMAASGDGNYYYIKSPNQLPDIFQTELQGLIATFGHKVSLGIQPANGVELLDVFNDMEKTAHGNYQLPNLMMGNSVQVVLRLKVPPMPHSKPLCQFRLAWDSPDTEARQVVQVPYQLPVVNQAALAEFSFNAEVQQQVAQLIAARAKQEAVLYADAGDLASAYRSLDNAKLDVLEAPNCDSLNLEMAAIDDLMANLDAKDLKSFRKAAKYEAYLRSRRASPEDYEAYQQKKQQKKQGKRRSPESERS